MKEMDIETHFKDTFRVFSKDEEGRMFIFIIIIIIIIIIIQSRFHDFFEGGRETFHKFD